MGTNYYTKENTCPYCGHTPSGTHLGKSSAGWTFSFQYNGGRFYKNVEEMKKWLLGKKIEDEYGQEIPHAIFWKMIKDKQKEPHIHALENSSPTEYFIGGYSFSDVEFS